MKDLGIFPPPCSTRNWRPGCSDGPRWAWRPSWSANSGSRWPRSTRHRTGPCARCPTRGSRTPHWTSRSSSSSGMALRRTSKRQARPSGHARNSRPCALLPQPSRASTRGDAPPALTRSATRAASPSSSRCGRTAKREAQRRDVTPGRVLRDAAIVAAARTKPRLSRGAPRDHRVADARHQEGGTALVALHREGTRAVREGAARTPRPRWRRPAAAQGVAGQATGGGRDDSRRRRLALAELSEQHDVPVENLLQPDAARRACWEYREGGVEWVRDFLGRVPRGRGRSN